MSADTGGDPRTPGPHVMVWALVKRLRERLYLPDADHVLFALAVAVSAKLEHGDPLWGMLLAPPSGGKTEVVNALGDCADATVDKLTEPGLLTYTRSRGKVTAAGLLTRLPQEQSAFVTISDFSTMLALSERGNQEPLFAALRRLYDGAYHRDLARPTPDTPDLAWSGRLTLLAACTAAIDHYSSHAAMLGDRWLYYRLSVVSADGRRAAQRRALKPPPETWLAEVRFQAGGVVQDAGGRLADGVSLPSDLEETVFDLAQVTCWGRAAVPRSPGGGRYIEGMPIVEEPPRVTRQLLLLARCLVALRCDDATVRRVVRQAALGSMPAQRQRVLEALVAAHKDGLPWASVSEVARAVPCNRNVARRTLEDLETVGLAARDGADDDRADDPRFPSRSRWQLSGENTENLSLLLRVMRG